MLYFFGVQITTEEFYLIIGKLGGFITALSAIIAALNKWMVKPIKKWKNEWNNLTDKIVSFENDLCAIKSEFKPNHGSSLRDLMDRIERKINTIDQEQRVMLDNDERAIFVTNDSGLCVWANKSFLMMIGYTLNEVLGHGWKNAIPSHIREKVVEEWNNAVSENRNFNMKLIYEHKNGTIISVETRADLLKSPDDKILGHFGIVKMKKQNENS